MKAELKLLDLLFQNRAQFHDVVPKSLLKKPHREVNLAEEFFQFLKRHPRLKISPKDAVDPKKSAQLVKRIHKELGLMWSYGGWLENREKLLAESYLKEKRLWIHLGIDINVPIGTPVLAALAGTVYKVDSDYSEGGWGNFVILEHQLASTTFYSISGHLSEEVLVAKGQKVEKGAPLGTVGKTDENGFWFPHTHFQFISEIEMRRQEKPFKLDGYGSPKDLAYLRENYPDPLVCLPMAEKE